MSGLLCCIRFTNFLSFDVNLLIFQLLIYRFPGYAISLVRKYPNFSGYSWMSNIKFINFWWNCFVVCTTIFSLRILTSKQMTPAFVISFLLRIQTPFHENIMEGFHPKIYGSDVRHSENVIFSSIHILAITSVLGMKTNRQLRRRHLKSNSRGVYFKWSTSVQVVGCWLFDHVIYLKLRRKITVAKTEKIFKNDNYFHSKWQLLTILSEINCHFVNLVRFENKYFLFSLR